MISCRNLDITIQYVYGEPVNALADKSSISAQRVYQILSDHARRIGIPLRMLRENPSLVKGRLVDSYRKPMWVGKDQAKTPEEFFWELLRESKIRTL